MKMQIVLASNNAGKLEEFQRMFAPLDVEILSLAQAGIHIEIPETGETFEENAAIKARTVYDIIKAPVVADDSGLEVDALGGAPGVYSARYAGEHATDDANIEKLLTALQHVPAEKRGGRFVSVLCYIDQKGTPLLVRGECEGRILTARQGRGGFGYDPVFYVESLGGTYGSIGARDKDRVSHRGKALRALYEKISAASDF